MGIVKCIRRGLLVVCLVLLCLVGFSQESRTLSTKDILQNIVGVFDIEGLPTGTRGVGISAFLEHNGHYYELSYKVMVESDGTMVLTNFELDREKQKPREAFVFPKVAPEEDPCASVRYAIKALKETNLDEWFRYIPEKERRGVDTDDLLRHIERDKKSKQEKGYSELDATIDNLPAHISIPTGVGALKIEYRVPSNVKGQDGYFDIEIECVIEEERPRNWLVHDVNINFRKK